MATYNILLMGASYGSLLASKLLFGGHSIHLVCLPAEADLINAEGFKVRLPVRGRKDPVASGIAQAARQGDGRSGGRGRSQAIRSHRSVHAGAAISLARRARAARRGRQVARALHVDHEHAAAALYQAHPRPRLQGAGGRLYRSARLGFVRSQEDHAEQPRPAGDPSAGRQGQRAAGHAADQLQMRPLRRRQGHRDPAPAREGRRRGALRYAGGQDRAAGQAQGLRIRSSCRSPNGRCCSPAIIAASPRTACAPRRKRCTATSRRRARSTISSSICASSSAPSRKTWCRSRNTPPPRNR